MHRKTTIIALTVAGVTLSALGASGIALAATDSSPSPSVSAGPPQQLKQAKIKKALAGLVTDGTLTQTQADKVASTLAQLRHGGSPGEFGGHGPAGMRHLLTTAATTLKLSEAELMKQLMAGKSLAQVAAAQKVPQATLVDALVKDVKTQLDAAVKAGKLTQAQADQALAKITPQIKKQVASAGALGHGMGRGMGPGGMGPGGMRGKGHGKGWDDAPGGSPSPSPTASPASSS